MDFQAYDEAVRAALAHIDEPNQRLFLEYAENFRSKLVSSGEDYNLENVRSELKALKDVGSPYVFKAHRKCQITIANEVFPESEIRNVLFEHSPYEDLPDWMKNVIEAVCSSNPEWDYQNRSQHRCGMALFFKGFLCHYSFKSFEEITITAIRDYKSAHCCSTLCHHFWMYFCQHNYPDIRNLAFLSDSRNLSTLLDKDDVDAQGCIQEHTLEEYWDTVGVLLGDKEKMGFSEPVLMETRRVYFNFGIFLGLYGYGYSKILAMRWMDAVYTKKGTGVMSQKAYLLQAGRMMDGETGAAIQSPYSRRSREFPEWSMRVVGDYNAERIQDGMSRSTLSNDRACLLRFVIFIDHKGIRCFGDLTPALIKEFNIFDTEHATPEAKNAYNVRIRNFLQFLERKRLTPLGLSKALLRSSSVSVRPVVVLSAEEDRRLQESFLGKDGGRTSLRDIAILKLERFMGLRVSDATSLRFDEIDVERMEIRIHQTKTGSPLVLPLPTTVLNSIVSYLDEARPDFHSPFIFLTSVHPYRPLASGNIPLAKRVLGDDFKKKNHTIRKTFATDLLVSGADFTTIANAIGHASNDTIHKYLDTDSETMRLCCLSLKGLEYKGGLF
jgi:site-specific recombinase XerD